MLAVGDEVGLDQAVETLKFLSDRNRLRILAVLTRAETCVCELIDELELPQSLISYHLRKLKDAGLVQARREAQWIYYSLDPAAWRSLTAPVVEALGTAPLPLAAAYGASHRCETMPADPARGACDEGCACCDP